MLKQFKIHKLDAMATLTMFRHYKELSDCNVEIVLSNAVDGITKNENGEILPYEGDFKFNRFIDFQGKTRKEIYCGCTKITIHTNNILFLAKRYSIKPERMLNQVMRHLIRQLTAKEDPRWVA